MRRPAQPGRRRAHPPARPPAMPRRPALLRRLPCPALHAAAHRPCTAAVAARVRLHAGSSKHAVAIGRAPCSTASAGPGPSSARAAGWAGLLYPGAGDRRERREREKEEEIFYSLTSGSHMSWGAGSAVAPLPSKL
uniref:Uncharacterized protein n=1 Tax=Setaria italica TaxID=4555 RepID=K3ZFN5_SETIT